MCIVKPVYGENQFGQATGKRGKQRLEKNNASTSVERKKLRREGKAPGTW
jgi:hypothetical protein